MGWETNFRTSIVFNRKAYETKSEVEKDLQEARDTIKDCKAKIRELVLQLIAVSNKELLRENVCEGEEPKEYIMDRLEEILDDMSWADVDDYKLTLLDYAWDDILEENRLAKVPEVFIDGKFIKYPAWDSPDMIDGDFIRTTRGEEKTAAELEREAYYDSVTTEEVNEYIKRKLEEYRKAEQEKTAAEEAKAATEFEKQKEIIESIRNEKHEN